MKEYIFIHPVTDTEFSITGDNFIKGPDYYRVLSNGSEVAVFPITFAYYINPED